MLDDITLYWLTSTGASSARLYWEAMSSGTGGAPSGPLAIPTGISMFPREQIRLSRRWAESRFSNLIHFDELDAGGHFAALEQPTTFVDQVRACFSTAPVTPGTVPALPRELVDLLRGAATCYLPAVMPDGSPQVTQTWVDTDRRSVLINTVIGHQKVKNIQRDARVTLALSSTTNPSRYFEVRGHVTDTTTTGTEEHIEALAHRYLGGPYPTYGGQDQERLILSVSPRRST